MANDVTLPRDLGDGLLLRQATVADTDALASFNAAVHGDEQIPDIGADIWTRDLMRGNHPTFQPGDFLLVEDTRAGGIASALCLVSQPWAYRGVPFDVGRIEMVGTAPAYRRRGLVRALFAAVHALSAARGEQVQAISGIPWYYRQFGYEMAMDLEATRAIYRADIPALEPGEREPFHLRPAAEADIPFMAACHDRGISRSRVVCLRDAARWRYELNGMSDRNDSRQMFHIIETPDERAVGCISHYAKLWRRALYLNLFECAEGASWLAVTPSVLRHVEAVGAALAERSAEPFDTIHLEPGQEHPLYAVFRKCRTIAQPSAWYLRVADLAGFLTLIASALERQPADSILVGHTGDLALNFYRTGIRLRFETGHLTGIEAWQPDTRAHGDAAFPDLTFLQLLFGFTSLDELERAFPDCLIHTDAAYALLNVLFPKQSSNVWPIA